MNITILRHIAYSIAINIDNLNTLHNFLSIFTAKYGYVLSEIQKTNIIARHIKYCIYKNYIIPVYGDKIYGTVYDASYYSNIKTIKPIQVYILDTLVNRKQILNNINKLAQSRKINFNVKNDVRTFKNNICHGYYRIMRNGILQEGFYRAGAKHGINIKYYMFGNDNTPCAIIIDSYNKPKPKATMSLIKCITFDTNNVEINGYSGVDIYNNVIRYPGITVFACNLQKDLIDSTSSRLLHKMTGRYETISITNIIDAYNKQYLHDNLSNAVFRTNTYLLSGKYIVVKKLSNSA